MKFAIEFESVPNRSSEDIKKNVSALIFSKDQLLENDYGSGDLYKFVTEILNYLTKLLNRFTSSLDEDIDYHSWIARNIYELFILAKYGLQSPEKISSTILTSVDDYLDIQSILFDDTTTPPADGIEFLEQMNQLDSIIKEKGREIEKWKSTGQMANETGSSFDHKLAFKLTSKYVHPTSLFLFGNKNFVHGKESRKAVFSFTQWYAAKLLLFIPEQIQKLKSAN